MKEANAELYNWQFHFTEGYLAKSEEIDAIADECKLFRAPTIIFSNNNFVAADKAGKIKILFNAKQAVKFLNYEHRQKNYCAPEQKGQINTISYIPQKLFVKHAEHWKNLEKPKNIEISQLQEVSDSFFLSSFKGLVQGNVKVERVKESVIPLEKLGPGNPITFYHQGSFYEDELDDNGCIHYQYKFRTMVDSWFALIRNYARIDSVTVLIYDTRLYWQLGWNKIARQFMVKSATWDQIKQKQGQLPAGWRMNPNQSHILYPFMSEKFVDNEYVHYS